RPALAVGAGANDLGVFAPRPRLRMRIENTCIGGEMERAMIETRVQGVRVVSKVLPVSGLFAVPEGEFGLYVDDKMWPGQWRDAPLRAFRSQDGIVVPCEAAAPANSLR